LRRSGFDSREAFIVADALDDCQDDQWMARLGKVGGVNCNSGKDRGWRVMVRLKEPEKRTKLWFDPFQGSFFNLF
jgi:hypothetical protein